MEIGVNTVAFVTVTALSAATIASGLAMASTASTVALVAYGILTVVLAGTSMAGISAWIATDKNDVREYFSNVGKHAGYAIAALSQLFVQVLVQSVIKAVAQGIGDAIYGKITGNNTAHISIA